MFISFGGEDVTPDKGCRSCGGSYAHEALSRVLRVRAWASIIRPLIAAGRVFGQARRSGVAFAPADWGSPTPDREAKTPPPIPDSEKRHVFVAMPFAEELQDTYEFGIYAPVRRCGFICEKVDEASFTGDILQRITERITTAEFVIADLTGERANVYLEVGYAWGKGVPVILLAREGEQVHFDVSTHRCIHYKRIGQLARELEKLIRGIYGLGPI